MKIEQNLVFKKNFEVTSSDADMFGRLKLSSLIEFLIQSAVLSADSLGFGLKFLQQENLFWVLSRLNVQILKPLFWYDKIEVETWPKTIDKLLYIRDFVVRDEKNEIVAKSTSSWLAIDLLSKRPKKIENIITDIFTTLNNKNAIDFFAPKIETFSGDLVSSLDVKYFDIDLNKHVTSSRYIDWITNCFDEEFHQNNYPKHLTINYLKEQKLKNNIQIYKKQKTENCFLFLGKNNETEAVKCEIEFEHC